jgi:lipoate-protein ligase A
LSQTISPRLFVYESVSADPYRNQAAEELIFRRAQPGEVYLYLWRNAHTIVIGRNQDAWRECLVDLFESEGGRFARRLSGGGAVYHDMGNLNFTFAARNDWYDLVKQTEVIREAARQFGIDAVRDGRNDILAGGRKFSGNAYYQQDDHRYHHGTILIETDMAKLGRYLNPHPEKLAGKGVVSVTSRVINLNTLCETLTVDAMKDAMIRAFESVYGGSAVCLAESDLPAYEWDMLTARYADRQWRLREPLPYTSRLTRRLNFGEMDIHLNISAGIINQAEVFTDAMDSSLAPTVAASLSGILNETARVVSALEPLTARWRDEIGAISLWLRDELS